LRVENEWGDEEEGDDVDRGSADFDEGPL